jgi:GWxTD domain-containing protein
MEKKPKDAVDKFWLNKINSNERARNLIINYYSRVQLANDLFTSHVEGWKTDRGLISIIFGSPNYVRKNKHYETWIYGNDHNSNTIKFTFEKIKNPFSSNDFFLKRSYAYKTPWYIAVENWRSGKVYWLQ